MLRKLCIAFTLIVLVSALSACSFGGGASSIEVQYSTNCSSATGQNTTCTVTLNNSSSSTGNFDWTATSSPAQFNPSSGSVAPGASSDQIQVTVPAGICPFTLTFSDADGTSVSSNQTSC